VTFGEGPLRFPLLVEAAETLFVPVAIRNNVEGYEGKIRARFDEPAWNNPVVRFLAGDGRDVLPRKDGVWQTGALLERMHRALAAHGASAPTWLTSVAAETASGEVESALFAMT
jgi:hypothetical protein